MDTRLRITAAFTAAAIFITCAFTGCAGTKKDVTITRLEACPEGSWQTTASFPDRKGYVDDTLVVNYSLLRLKP
ncbi:MAG: hypothetical protein IJI87_07945 [Mogibacterium sp.]|nr:hypothetical protein [Mogibacterium sp.]